jgi:TRAP-type C4-dicarboxylate transport system substrate-binding protein
MLTTRAFERARHVIDLPWGFVLGATVIPRETWERIPADLRPVLLAIASEEAQRIDADARRLEREAMEAMARAGLSVVPVDRAAWSAALERTWPVLRAEVVPPAFFDAVVAARDACRLAAPASLPERHAARAAPGAGPSATRR